MSSKPPTKGPLGRPSAKSTSAGATPTMKTSPVSAPARSKPSTASGTGASGSYHHTPSASALSSSSVHTLQTYREIFIARSDGVGYTTQQINDASRSAQPVGDALDDNHDFVRSWTVKLGKAIKYNLGIGATSTSMSNDPNNYLVRLPQGYSLHVRPGKTKDRDGPFVFGHPLGPIAAFRSPAELALHILWLLSNSKSRGDCSCRLCVRMVSEMAAAAAAAAAPPAVKASPRPPAVTPVPIPVIPTPATAASPVQALAAPSKNINNASALPDLPVGGSSGLFRPWELVWYQHFTQPSRGAWRLGIVLGSDSVGDNGGAASVPPSTMPGPVGTIRIAPIGFQGLQQLMLNASDLRPFLSFSVPAMREGFQGMTYDQINWQQLVADARQRQQQQQQQLGPYDGATIALEASKSSANQINACFSVFNAKPKAPDTPRTYGGVFLGAEAVLLGDALRVDAKDYGGAQLPPAIGPVTVDIMQVSLIMVDGGHLRFFGDVYRLSVAPAGSILPPGSPGGQVFAEELAERNHHVQHQQQGGAPVSVPTWYWHVCERNGSRAEGEVHGRFYASTRLAANLQNVAFFQRLQADSAAATSNPSQVVYQDSSIMASALNRRQRVAGFMYQGQRPNRAATIGQAISISLPAVTGLQEEY